MLKKDLIELVKKKHPTIKNLSKLLKKDLIQLLEEDSKMDIPVPTDIHYNLNNDKIKKYIQNCDSNVRHILEKIFANTIHISFHLLTSYINEILDEWFNEITKNKLDRPIFIYKSTYELDARKIWIIDYIINYLNIKYKSLKILLLNDNDFNDTRLKSNDIILFADYFITDNKSLFNYYPSMNSNNLTLNLYVLSPIITDNARYDILKKFYINKGLNKCNLIINNKGINDIKIVSDVLNDKEIFEIDKYYNIIIQTYDRTIKNKYLIYFDNCVDYQDDYLLTPIYTGLILNEDNMKLLKKSFKNNKVYNNVLKSLSYIPVINNYNETYDINYTLPPLDVSKMSFTTYIQEFKKDKNITFHMIKDIQKVSYVNKYRKETKTPLKLPTTYKLDHNLNKEKVKEFIKKTNKPLQPIIQKIYKYTEYISFDTFTSILSNVIDDAVKYLSSNIIYILNESSNKFKEQSKHSIEYIITYINHYYPSLKIEIINNYDLRHPTLKDNDVVLIPNDYLISGIAVNNTLIDITNSNKLKLNLYIISSCYTTMAKASIYSSFYTNKLLNRCNIIFNDNLMKFINDINHYINTDELDNMDIYYYDLTQRSAYRKSLVLFQHLLLDSRDIITPLYYGFIMNNHNLKLIRNMKYLNYEDNINYILKKMKYINIINNPDVNKYLFNPNKLDYNIINNIQLLE